jgi:hypothetical protein
MMSQLKAQSHQEGTDDLATLVESLANVSRMMLFCFLKDDISLKDQIASNFLARSTGMLESIHLLWKTDSKDDACIIQRCQLERLFLLRHLHTKNEYEKFSDYTFITLHESRNKLLSNSDPEIRSKYEKQLRLVQQKNRLKYAEIKAKGKPWSRPKSEELAKGMDAHYLYDVGYDYASRHVHPMASDGAEFLERLAKSNFDELQFNDTVVRNSVLTQTMIMQVCMNISDFQWKVILIKFIEDCRNFFIGDKTSYRVTFLKIAEAGPDFELCSGGATA